MHKAWVKGCLFADYFNNGSFHSCASEFISSMEIRVFTVASVFYFQNLASDAKRNTL